MILPGDADVHDRLGPRRAASNRISLPDQAAAVLRTFEPSSIVALGSIDAARRRVERIILRVGGIVLAVIVVAVVMVVLDEARAVGCACPPWPGVIVTSNPCGSGISSTGPQNAPRLANENTGRARFVKRLHLHPIRLRPRQPEAGPNAIFENRQLDGAMASVDALQLWPMNSRRFGAAEKGKVVAVTMPVAVSMNS